MFQAGLAGVVYVKPDCVKRKRNKEQDHEDQVYKKSPSATLVSLGQRDGGHERLNLFFSPALYMDWLLAQHRNFQGLDSISQYRRAQSSPGILLHSSTSMILPSCSKSVYKRRISVCEAGPDTPSGTSSKLAFAEAVSTPGQARQSQRSVLITPHTF